MHAFVTGASGFAGGHLCRMLVRQDHKVAALVRKTSDTSALEQLVERIAPVVGGRGKNLRVPLWPIMAMALACETACRPIGIEPPLHRRRVEFFTVNRAFDISRALKQLGYQPRVSLDDGLRRTASWYEGQGFL